MFFPLGLRCVRLYRLDGFHFLWLVKTAYDDHFSFYGDLTSHASCAFVKKPTHFLMVYITFLCYFSFITKILVSSVGVSIRYASKNAISVFV